VECIRNTRENTNLKWNEVNYFVCRRVPKTLPHSPLLYLLCVHRKNLVPKVPYQTHHTICPSVVECYTRVGPMAACGTCVHIYHWVGHASLTRQISSDPHVMGLGVFQNNCSSCKCTVLNVQYFSVRINICEMMRWAIRFAVSRAVTMATVTLSDGLIALDAEMSLPRPYDAILLALFCDHRLWRHGAPKRQCHSEIHGVICNETIQC
jgi:hypothetical protein